MTEVRHLEARQRYDREAGMLVGSVCRDCRSTSWPPRVLCNRCGGRALSVLPLSGSASLLTCTTVMIPRPGLEAPYILGQARLEEGPIILGQVKGLVEHGSPPAKLRVVVARDEESMPPFWFEPA